MGASVTFRPTPSPINIAQKCRRAALVMCVDPLPVSNDAHFSSFGRLILSTAMTAGNTDLYYIKRSLYLQLKPVIDQTGVFRRHDCIALDFET